MQTTQASLIQPFHMLNATQNSLNVDLQFTILDICDLYYVFET